MATLIANADGNLTGASTFASAETSSLKANRNLNTGLTSPGSVTSPTFTVSNGAVIDGVLLWICLGNTSPATGTIQVDLQKGGVTQATVTVNKSDVPDNNNSAPCPVFFKFTSTATGDGGSNWRIVLTITGASAASLSYYRASSTVGDLTRALRTTTAATPAAGDDLFILGELTGAGTHNARAVTMDSTAATAYGNGSVNSTTVAGGLLAISNYGTLSYGNSAATNYILRVAGDVNVYQYGTLNIGVSGAEIPRNSTAVLEFQQVSANGDFGLQNRGGTVNIAGLSRTSGKNIVKTKLNADAVSSNISPLIWNSNAGTLTQSGSVGADGVSALANSFAESTANSTHGLGLQYNTSVTNTTQTGVVWLARGSGTNNRYVRFLLGNANAPGSVTNGFYVDVDLQAGTVGTVTALGNGTATSASITPLGGGYLVKITGKVSTSGTLVVLWIIPCSAPGTTSFAGSNTQAFIFDHMNIVTAASVSDTTFSVVDDTGWLSGDIIIVASTTRTASECEVFPLNADAGSSSLISSLPLFGGTTSSTHSGTSPTQAEVGLLTRNVKIRSTSPSLKTYVYCTALSVLNASWAEFYFIGVTSITGKRGIEIDSGTTAGAKNISYCSLHDSNSELFYAGASGTSINLTFSHNILWNSGSAGSRHASTTFSDFTVDDNLCMFPNGSCFIFGSISGAITNNVAVGFGSSAYGFSLSAPGGPQLVGTFQNNVAHSGLAGGMLYGVLNAIGVIDGFTSWRNSGYGIQISSSSPNMASVKFTNLTMFGNGNSVYTQTDVLNISGATICGDSSFATTRGIYSQQSSLTQYNFDNVDMNPGTGIFAPHTTADFAFVITVDAKVEAFFNNCNFGAPNLIDTTSGKTNWSSDAFMSFQRYNKTNADHRTELTYGQLKTDSVIYNTASPSMRMTPSDAVNKLESAPFRQGILVPVANGAAMNVSAYVRKSVSGDGAAYNGNQPRLIQRANPALGQNSDIVLTTASGAAGSWEKLTGTTSTATDDGAWEIVVDCDGTAGWINVDDFDWSVA